MIKLNVALASLLLCGVTQAGPIFDSMPGDSFAATGTMYDDVLRLEIGGSFTVAADATLDSVQIPFVGYGNVVPDTAGIKIRSDAGGFPGATIADLGTQNLPFDNAGFQILTFAGSGELLSAGSTYWVVVDAGFATGGIWANSIAGDTGANASFDAPGFGQAGVWGSLTNQLAFRVNATPSGTAPQVPEPGTLALLALAGGAAIALRVRSRSRDSR